MKEIRISAKNQLFDKQKNVHPFPARMAQSLVGQLIDNAAKSIRAGRTREAKRKVRQAVQQLII